MSDIEKAHAEHLHEVGLAYLDSASAMESYAHEFEFGDDERSSAFGAANADKQHAYRLFERSAALAAKGGAQ